MSAQAAWMAEDPRVPGWMIKATLMARFNYCPEDPDEAIFLLEMISHDTD